MMEFVPGREKTVPGPPTFALPMPTDHDRGHLGLPRALSMLLLLGALVVLLGVARLWGPGLRESALLSFDESARGSFPSYSDAPTAATMFFETRDSALVTVPRDMSVGEFLALYHLSNHDGVRAALRDQHGVVADGDELRRGTQVRLPLSPRNGSP
jgi:hypothetical protein